MHARSFRTTRAALVLAGALALAACGSDDATTSADVTAEVTLDQTTDAPESSAPTTAPSDTSAALTGAEICERLTIESVAADLGVDVTTAEPDDSSTPQCAYLYDTGTGVSSNLTIAAMRPADVGGMSGEAAFDFVVGINRQVAGDDAEEQTINAGDNAIRLSGSSLHLGVVQLGDNVYTLIVPADDTEPAAVDQLITTMATTLA
jgi:hypothetical protein